MGVHVSFNPKTSNTYAGSQNITIAEKILAGGNGTPVFNVANLSWNDTVTADLTAGANPIQVGSNSNLSYGGVAGTTTYLFTRWIDLSMNRFTASGNSAIYAAALNASATFSDAIGGNGCSYFAAGRFMVGTSGAGVSAITEASGIVIESPSYAGGTVVASSAGLRIKNQGTGYSIFTGTGTAQFGGDIIVNGITKQAAMTVASLPAGSVGQRSFVTNALAPAFGVAVAGGGAVGVPVYHDGTSWKVG